jgi:putative nucleotidyltransferase with HDIG domain
VTRVKKIWKPFKSINNLFFLLSIIVIVLAWPVKSHENWLHIAGRTIIVASYYLTLYVYLAIFFSDVFRVTSKTLFILLLILSFIIITKIALSYSEINLLPLIPFALIPVMIRTFYDARLALFILLFTILIALFFVPDPFDFAMVTFVSGMTAIFTQTFRHRKAVFLSTVAAVIISCSVVHTGLAMMEDGNLNNLFLSDYIMYAGNGFLLLLSYPLIFLLEKKFMFLSDITLLELSDTGQPLLRKLAAEAPGSFQHSLQVANLAEEAAIATGSDLLLVRTGALYHDIGKISVPDYFIENQKNGSSPHDNMNPAESARLIINHVESGVVLARNFKLPVQIIDFIRTHHGTSVTYYFYRKFMEIEPWNTGKEKEFTYPGPKPFSRETAIVMMADAVEASSRSLEKQTEESISELVERIILLQEQDGQYSNVPFTYRDISDIKEAFKKRLLTIYHGRIAYPER